MFALYKDDQFYLHIPNHCLEENIAKNLSLLIDSQTGINLKSFYLIPSNMLNDIQQFSYWVTESVKDILNTKQNQYIKKKKCIRTLPNMTIQLERTLKKLGVYSIDDLVDRGEIDIFVNLLKIGVDADQALLFRLHGAINRQYIYTISDKTKQNLLNDADNALYAAGLRKRFNTR